MSTPMAAAPQITVIALCYNHARFVECCLDSIRAQSFRDFELIVTDDCSRDESPAIITHWLARHYPAARFIRHTANSGLCKTLNEALSHARGRYISMIATDDTWQPEKLSRQFAAIEACEDDVAMIYSDAFQMDENGRRLERSFLEAHGIAGAAPSGEVFSRIADGNFLPAMATLVRLDALQAVGGYDENLTYEDFDMWLRLASRYRFGFCPGRLASYRSVSTSMVRTLFEEPTPAHAHSVFLIAEKWLKTDRLSGAQRKRWIDRQATAAYLLYRHEDSRATRCLWDVFRATRRPRLGMLALTHTMGLSRRRLRRLASLFGETKR
jgi:glycosyltransferase involved in cell wall biosynthesis